MKGKKKPQYSVLGNLVYSVKLVWKYSRILLFFSLGSGFLKLTTNLVQLYLAPVILQRVELSVPLTELFCTIGAFTAALLVCNGLSSYIQGCWFVGESRIMSGTNSIRLEHSCTTSYMNLLDTKFREKETSSVNAVFNDSNHGLGNMVPHTVEFGVSLVGFGLYLLVLRNLPSVLLAVVMVTAVVSYLVGRNADKWSYSHSEEAGQIRHRKGYIINLAMGNEMPKDIRIFGMRGWLDDVWEATLDLWRSFCNKRELRQLAVKGADVLLSLARNGIAYVYLIRMALADGLSASEFLLYFSAVTGFTSWITTILNSVSEMYKTSLQICEFREYMDWPEPFKFEEGKAVSKDDFDRYELRMEDVSFRYPESGKDTISHINLTIRPGEKLAIVGLNGAGKTTLIKLLCGFLDPTEGRVLLNGQDIREFNRKDYYTLFTAVFQEVSRLQVTVAQNIAQSFDEIDHARLAQCVERAGLTKVIAELPNGLDTVLGWVMGNSGIWFSGGQLQRLMLARALYKDAPILMLDEPTAALDPIAENEIYQQYNEMTQGRTSVYISHRLASTRFCDRIIFLENGGIAEEGSHDELMALGGRYCRLFDVQSKYYREGGAEDEK